MSGFVDPRSGTTHPGHFGDGAPPRRSLYPMLEPFEGCAVLVRVRDIELLQKLGFRRLTGAATPAGKGSLLPKVTMVRPNAPAHTISVPLGELEGYWDEGWLIVGEPGTESKNGR